MTHQRIESDPTAGRGLFVSGIVLGLSVGLAAGHLLLFARSAHKPVVTASADEFPPFDPAGLVSSGTRDVVVPNDVSFSIMEVDDPQDVGRVTISDRKADENLHFFPEAVNPARTAAPMLAATVESDRKPTRMALAGEETSTGPHSLPPSADQGATSSAPAPHALEPAPGAAPIDERTSQQEQLTRSIIDEELPDATPQERDVWREVLHGLPPEDIKGILRMRKHIGPGQIFATVPAPSALSPVPAQHGNAAPPSDPATSKAPASISNDVVDRLLARIERHNQANRQTVAYKRLVPVLAERAWDDAAAQPPVRLPCVIRDMTQGAVQLTGRLMDVAVQGPGFFQVRCGDDVRYTRDGRLTRDAEGRLKLLSAEDDWLIDPPIIVPCDTTDVIIAEDGHVSVVAPQSPEPVEVGSLALWSFLNPEFLRVDATGLYAATDDAGTPFPLPTDATSASSLVQRHLEASNAAPTAYRPTDSRR